jgi:hypothetical protein
MIGSLLHVNEEVLVYVTLVFEEPAPRVTTFRG